MEPNTLIPGWFTYLAWTLGSPRIGPFVLPDGRRDEMARSLVSICAELEDLPGAGRVRVLVSTLVPPLRGGPRYDVVLLARGEDPIGAEAVARVQRAGLPQPTLVATARNTVRFGDTDAVDGTILLNHFVGDVTPSEAETAWTEASRWYADVLHVDNSTLLQFEQPCPFLVMNYVRIPASAGSFMVQQLTRPSFYRDVQRRLGRAGLRPYPTFLTSVTS